MKWFISQETIKSHLQDLLKKDCGQNVRLCYQCGKCSAGCPTSFQMDYLPNQIVRMIQLGMEKEALSSRTIWLCASCLICTARCPREIDIAEIMDFLRRRAYKKHILPKGEAKIPLFNKIFLKNIETFGRLYEMGLIAMFNMLSGEFFKDFSVAPKMFVKQKIGILPPKIGNKKEVKEIFRKSGKLSGVQRDRLLNLRFIFLNLAKKFINRIERLK